MIPISEAMERLRSGNQRHVRAAAGHPGRDAAEPPGSATPWQQPFAAILGCSDSRVPPELVFDQGPGQLFVVRVAGNVVDPAGLGSLEFAVEQLRVRTVVVLGHSDCGAVTAAVRAHGHDDGRYSPGLRAILGRIAPPVSAVARAHPGRSVNALIEPAVRANVHHSLAELLGESAVLRRRVEEGDVALAGAVYDLTSRVVEFLESQV